MGIQVIPETLAVLLVVRQIINLIVLLIILYPVAAPETIDNVLRLGRGEKDDGVLVDGSFEAGWAEDGQSCVGTRMGTRGATLRGNGGRNIAVLFAVPVSRTHDALEPIDPSVVHDPPCKSLACDRW